MWHPTVLRSRTFVICTYCMWRISLNWIFQQNILCLQTICLRCSAVGIWINTLLKKIFHWQPNRLFVNVIETVYMIFSFSNKKKSKQFTWILMIDQLKGLTTRLIDEEKWVCRLITIIMKRLSGIISGKISVTH